APPPGLGPVEAASVWMQFFTAFGIVQAGRLALGDFVLIPAASSSVGLAAIPLANWLGAESIAMTRTSAKRDARLAQGARHVIASQECDVAAEVMRITGAAAHGWCSIRWAGRSSRRWRSRWPTRASSSSMAAFPARPRRTRTGARR